MYPFCFVRRKCVGNLIFFVLSNFVFLSDFLVMYLCMFCVANESRPMKYWTGLSSTMLVICNLKMGRIEKFSHDSWSNIPMPKMNTISDYNRTTRNYSKCHDKRNWETRQKIKLFSYLFGITEPTTTTTILKKKRK